MVVQQVPVGNFENDWLLFTIDAFFSRDLRDHKQVSFDIFFERIG